ncbi:MAG TPA: exodeoxyribonuclease V subunit gamma [Candidatus Paceibacterota bacterium]|nr:exodeoxyribonuclease V subunit gamma [Candidatus Paceibacterota bacterium]
MSLVLCKSNRMEKLVERLVSRILEAPLSSPFVPEVIVVETQGMAQWLKLELAKAIGIAANIEFPFPRAFISGLVESLVTAGVQAGPIEPDALAWRVMGQLDGLRGQAGFEEIRSYLAASGDPRRKFQLAERIASLLDQYSVYRPEWIAAWQEGRESSWQAILWRAVMTGGLACQGLFLYELIHALSDPACDRARIPERASLFVTGSLPPSYLDVFEALAQRISVHMFWLCPCSEYWGDIVTPREAARIQARTGAGNIDPQDLHLETINPLLAACGKTGRAFQDRVADLQAIEGDDSLFAPSANNHLLARIQNSILALEDAPPPAKRPVISKDDRSVQVHNCHSPLRELQVLRDHLLEWFSADPTLSPQDVVVMMADGKAYAPFVKGVFGSAEPDVPAIPYAIADRGARDESALVGGWTALLQLSSSRLTATEVTDLLQTPAVRRRFGIAEDEIGQIQQWIQTASIRWGRDKQHREQLGLPPFEEHTWEHGCGRLLLGYAMADGGHEAVSGLMPCEGIEGTATDLLGRWLDFLQTLLAAMDDLARDRSIEGWAAVLSQWLDAIFLPAPEEERAASRIRQVLDALRQEQRISGFDESVSLKVILERVLPRLEEEPPGRAHLKGAVTFCGLNPVRGIPFRVVCLLGMQDGRFPRTPTPPSFDLMAQRPQPGDPSQRDEDRYLFLQSILSARDRLHISYVGQSVQDNSPRPPSVVVSELLDYIRSRFDFEPPTNDPAPPEPSPLVVVHRLHAFSPAYYRQGEDADPRLFGYSPAFARISRALANPADRPKIERFLAKPLSASLPQSNEVTLIDLQRFFRNPARSFVEIQLQFRLPEESELASDEEPFSLDALASYQCMQEMLEAGLAGKPASSVLDSWSGAGKLPPGTPGRILGNALLSEANSMTSRVRTLIGEAKIERIPFSRRIGGFTLEGELACYPSGLVQCRAADVNRERKGDAHLRLWIEHLVLQLVRPKGERKSWLFGKDQTWVFKEAPDAESILGDLLELYAEGMGRPLPFFPRTAFAYALARARDPEKPPEESALHAWEGSEFAQGEREDPYFDLCFRNDSIPLGEDFQKIAWQIVAPILDHQAMEAKKEATKPKGKTKPDGIGAPSRAKKRKGDMPL